MQGNVFNCMIYVYMFFVPYLNSIWLKPFTDFSLHYTTLLYFTLPYPTLPYNTLPNPALPYPTQSCPTLPYPTLSYPTLYYLIQPCPTLPYPTLPSLFISRVSGICLCHADES